MLLELVIRLYLFTCIYRYMEKTFRASLVSKLVHPETQEFDHCGLPLIYLFSEWKVNSRKSMQ